VTPKRVEVESLQAAAPPPAAVVAGVADPGKPPVAAAPPAVERVRISPLAAKIALELGVDVNTIKGSGRAVPSGAPTWSAPRRPSRPRLRLQAAAPGRSITRAGPTGSARCGGSCGSCAPTGCAGS